MTKEIYIQPRIKTYNSLAEVKNDPEDDLYHLLFDRGESSPSIPDLAVNFRNIVMGEQGIGKTRFLKKVEDFYGSESLEVCSIGLKMSNVCEQIDKFIKKGKLDKKVLIMDGLDEASTSSIGEIVTKIDFVSKEYPNLRIWISSRPDILGKHEQYFIGYRFTKVLHFSRDQISTYLKEVGYNEEDINSLLGKVNFGRGRLVIQTPRYLDLLVRFVNNDTKKFSGILNISRNELFDYFISSKLEIEDGNSGVNKNMVTKRVLEKLALVMEVYQNNVITIDDLSVFFDEIDSDLKLFLDPATFLDKSILQSKDGNISFENVEFQEYLAAREVMRFDDPHRALFKFSTDQRIDGIMPSWLNVFAFVIDFMPEMLAHLLQFVDLDTKDFMTTNEVFFEFITRIDPNKISEENRKRLFLDVINFYERNNHWLSGPVVSALPAFFYPDFEIELKTMFSEGIFRTGLKRDIILANVSYVVAYLFDRGIQLDKVYWNETLMNVLINHSLHSVTQRHVLIALKHIKNKTIIERLADGFKPTDSLVDRELISLFAEVDPDNETSLKILIDAIKRDNITGRIGIVNLSTKKAIFSFLQTYVGDSVFRNMFLDDVSTVNEEDKKLVKSIGSHFDESLEDLCVSVIIKSLDYTRYRSIEQSSFVNGILNLLLKNNEFIIYELVERLNGAEGGPGALDLFQAHLVEILSADNVDTFVDAMLLCGKKEMVADTMIRIKYSTRADRNSLYEHVRGLLPEEYNRREQLSQHGESDRINMRRDRTLNVLKGQIVVDKDHYNPQVFRFYKDHYSEIGHLLNKADEKKLRGLVKNGVLKFNPMQHEFRIISEKEDGHIHEFNYSEIVPVFGDALFVAEKLGIDLSKYRKNIVSYIPYANDKDDLKELFRILGRLSNEEIQLIIGVYGNINIDLRRYRPDNFIEIIRQYHLVSAVPLLKDFVYEQKIPEYVRVNALRTIQAICPDDKFLRQVFDEYKNISAENKNYKVMIVANELLIYHYADHSSIDWRINQIKNQVILSNNYRSLARPVHVRKVSLTEGELLDRSFAKPLMEMRVRGFEQAFLELLDRAIELWVLGEDYHRYAEYIWKIVYSYFDNLKSLDSYQPLKLLEEKVAKFASIEGGNWLSQYMAGIRQSYVSYLGKPKSFSTAVRIYNEAKLLQDMKISNAADLFNHLKDIINEELTRWIEHEGAYQFIVSNKPYAKGNKDYESLIQKTIKIKLAHALQEKGLKIEISREEQLLDGKRVDLIIRHGFIGPIILELKLSSHSHLRVKDISKSESYLNMVKYTKGYAVPYGIFLIIDNKQGSHVKRALDAYSEIPNVWAKSIKCATSIKPKKKTKVLPVKKITKSVKKKKR